MFFLIVDKNDFYLHFLQTVLKKDCIVQTKFETKQMDTTKKALQKEMKVINAGVYDWATLFIHWSFRGFPFITALFVESNLIPFLGIKCAPRWSALLRLCIFGGGIYFSLSGIADFIGNKKSSCSFCLHGIAFLHRLYWFDLDNICWIVFYFAAMACPSGVLYSFTWRGFSRPAGLVPGLHLGLCGQCFCCSICHGETRSYGIEGTPEAAAMLAMKYSLGRYLVGTVQSVFILSLAKRK